MSSGELFHLQLCRESKHLLHSRIILPLKNEVESAFWYGELPGRIEDLGGFAWELQVFPSCCCLCILWPM